MVIKRYRYRNGEWVCEEVKQRKLDGFEELRQEYNAKVDEVDREKVGGLMREAALRENVDRARQG